MKYKLRKDLSIIYNGNTLYRIQALKDFNDVNKGDLGGFVQNEQNLSQENNAWVYDYAMVYGDAWVYGDAKVFDDAWISDSAEVFGNIKIKYTPYNLTYLLNHKIISNDIFITLVREY